MMRRCNKDEGKIAKNNQAKTVKQMIGEPKQAK
jgi:hypothetical protein